MKKYLALAGLLILAGALGGQEKPKLKPEVALELRNAQWESAKVALQMKQLEAQYQTLQAQSVALNKSITDKMATALERSGIDAKKYEINGDTLEVTPKPEPKKP